MPLTGVILVQQALPGIGVVCGFILCLFPKGVELGTISYWEKPCSTKGRIKETFRVLDVTMFSFSYIGVCVKQERISVYCVGCGKSQNESLYLITDGAFKDSLFKKKRKKDKILKCGLLSEDNHK